MSQDKPVCRVCGKWHSLASQPYYSTLAPPLEKYGWLARLVLGKASNTTNLFQHFREHHPMIYAELAPKKLVALVVAYVLPQKVSKVVFLAKNMQ